MADQDNELIHLTIDVVTAFVGQNNMRPEDVPALIANVHKAVRELQGDGSANGISVETDQEETVPEYAAAVTVRKSLGSREHILSMIDGRPYKTLKRHLGQHGLTPAQYRERYKLKADYPMVAPAYSEARKAMAHKLGLGRKVTKREVAAKAPAVPAAKPATQPASLSPAVASKGVSATKAPAKRVARSAAKVAGNVKTKSAAESSGKAGRKASGAVLAKRGRPAKSIGEPATATVE